MDEFEDRNEAEELEEKSGSRLGMIALWVAVVGIVVGVAGIVLANQAQRNLAALEADMESQPDKVPELEAAVESLEERLERLGSEFVKLNRQDNQIRESTQEGFNQVQRTVQANRSGLNELNDKLTELVERLENWQPPRSRTPAVEPAQDSEEDSATVETERTQPESGIHRVTGGDTLSKIAKEYGVTLSELQRANPTVNPRALQIGQEIVIPED
jgi:LysM repeat protein